MKVSLITETFPPEVNGVAMTLHQIVGGMVERGHHFSVVAPRRNDRPEGKFNFPVISVPGLPIPRYNGLRFGLPAYRRLLREWKTDRPDVVHIATEGPLGWSAVRAAEKLGIPLVSSFHTNFHQYGSHYGYGWFGQGVLKWLRHLHNRTRLTFAPSSVLLKELQTAGFNNLHLMGRGVDTQRYGPHRRDVALRASWGASDQTPVALYTGRVAAEKNMPLSIEAFRAMQKILPQMRMVIVGDGPALKTLQKQNPDLIFAGMRHGEDLARHYASADCFLFASITETFGNVVTEAMASGLAVLAYHYAAPATYIQNGINGYSADLNNPAAYMEAARNMAHNHQQWHNIGQAAVQTMQPISWKAIVGYYEHTLMANI